MGYSVSGWLMKLHLFLRKTLERTSVWSRTQTSQLSKLCEPLFIPRVWKCELQKPRVPCSLQPVRSKAKWENAIFKTIFFLLGKRGGGVSSKPYHVIFNEVTQRHNTMGESLWQQDADEQPGLSTCKTRMTFVIQWACHFTARSLNAV